VNLQDQLLALRGLLLPLAERFEADPALAPAAGALLARIPVVGGRFVHPLTREPVAAMRVYAAGPDRVKILEPRFLRSLPPVPVAGLTQPAQFCALVARSLGEALGDLGRLRDALRAAGLALDLEQDVLRLRGQTTLGGVRVELVGQRPAGLVVVGLHGHPLAGRVPFEERLLALAGEPAADLVALTRLVQALAGRRRPEPPVEPEQLQPIELEQEYTPEVKPHLAAAVAGQGALSPDLSEPDRSAPPSEIMELTDLADEPAYAPPGREELQPAVAVPAPVPPVAPPAAPAPATGTDAGSAAPGTAKPGEGLGSLELGKLLDLFGQAAQVSAFGGKLRLVAPMRVVQGEFTFYLEQSGARVFRGFLVSPQGHRYPVEVDLGVVFDLKEIYDRVMMGR